MADHPRIRGEHAAKARDELSLTGSSPHTRGALQLVYFGVVGAGIIPAYAGSTQVGRILTYVAPDHPRIRGEHRRQGLIVGQGAGSSPHTRGAPPEAAGQDRKRRIIPAYAGSTGGRVQGDRTGWDHPRIRGEHRERRSYGAWRVGSSPHTRGAPGVALGVVPHTGIIPAYAGSTPVPGGSSATRRDHPRIRGEHPTTSSPGSSTGGSSPHTRGARGGSWWPGRCRGIIPAYAGSTGCAGSPGEAKADHPRIRGEHAPVVEVAGREPGSSPHTRGALFGRPVCGRSARIIPAYAGSTARRPPNLRPSADHPRIRGEHVAEMFKFPDHPGSSPHTRGAPRF